MNNRLSDSPIYVIGTPRSGTTLIAKVLGLHSRIFMPGETHFFEDIYSQKIQIGNSFDNETKRKILKRLLTLYKRYNEPKDQKRIDYLLNTPEKIEKLISEWNNYRDVLVSFVKLQMNYEGKKRWGNNVPRDIFNYEDILSFFPNAKIIVCLRDPRDFLLSYKGKWRITSTENIKRMKLLYHPILTSLIWKSSTNLIPVLKRKVPSSNLMIIKYEIFVHEVIKTVKQLCNFIEEQYEPQMLNIDSSNSSHHLKTKGIYKSTIGLWRKKLPADEAYLSQLILKNELKYAGYKKEKIKVSHYVVAKHLFTFPYKFILVMKSNISVKGPLFPYIIRRLKTIIFKI